MSNYQKLYYTLFSGVSNLIENSRPGEGETAELREALIALTRRCEELYITEGEP